MARINRSDVINKAVNDLAISLATDSVPNECSDKIVLTYNLNRQVANITRVKNFTSTGVTAIYTIGAKEEFYLTSVQLAGTQDATCDGVFAQITYVQDGGTRTAIIRRFPPLTANSTDAHIAYTYPIKCDSGTDINIQLSFTVGTASYSGIISGYKLSSN